MKHNQKIEESKHRLSGKRMMRIIGATIVGIFLAGLFALLFGFLVKILWNSLMPAIFGLGPITYWQAFGIVILAKLLFGGFGPHRNHHHPDHFHKKIDDRWHRFIGVDSPRDPHHKTTPSRWHLYERFWREEGSAAFENFVQKVESQAGAMDQAPDSETES